MTRETQARFKRSVAFFGVEGSVPVLVISALASVACMIPASGQHNVFLLAVAASPVTLTYAYMRFMITGRRPHFARDGAIMRLPGGKAVSPRTPASQPLHPALPRAPRGQRF
jgi:hypothetical protein